MTVKEYGNYLKVEKGMSQNTVTSYCHDVKCLEDWLEGTLHKKADEVTADDLTAYLQSLTESEDHPAAGKSKGGDRLSKRSQARTLSAIRSYFAWLVIEGYIEENPCDGIDSPKLGAYLPEVLSVEEIDRIMNSVPTDSWFGLRNRATLELLYGCGLRVSEAATLKISQIYFKEGFVRVIGKGDKERLVPMGEVAAEWVLKYLAVRPVPAEPRHSDFLLLNKDGAPISRVAIFKMIKKTAFEAGITKEISPHTFRHSFATHLIENGADLRVVQEMLGHESILTTEIYTHIDQATWQASVLSRHPRGGK